MDTKKIIIYSLVAVAVIAGAYYGYKWYKKSTHVDPPVVMRAAINRTTAGTAQTGVTSVSTGGVNLADG